MEHLGFLHTSGVWLCSWNSLYCLSNPWNMMLQYQRLSFIELRSTAAQLLFDVSHFT